LKTSQLIKEIKTKIETFTYDGIDEAIKLAEEHGTADFYDKFLGELQLRCVRYNSDHVCSEATFFNRNMRGMKSHFTYRALLGLVNIACKGSKAYEFRKNMKSIKLYGHIWHDGLAYGGNVDLKYIKHFDEITNIQIEEAGTISNLELINSFKNLKNISICGPLRSSVIPYSLRDIPLTSSKLSLPDIKWECNFLEELLLMSIEEIENLQFISGLKNLKTICVNASKLNSFSGIPTTIEDFRFKVSRLDEPIKDSEFETLQSLKNLRILEIESDNSDFSFLSGLTKLEQLTISSSSEKITIPKLSNLKKLRYISLTGSIQNLDFLEKNEEIEMIRIFDSTIKSIMGLQNCKKIKVIYLVRCDKLTTLTGLENCKELDIDIRNTGIENLDGLKGCSKLSNFGTKIIEYFHIHGGFSSTDVETYPDGSTNLDYVIRNNTLYISGCNNLIDISGIKNATNLMGLSITSCESLKNIRGIETLQNLYDIDFSGCSALEDISIVKNFPKLKSLNLSGCKKLKVKPKSNLLDTIEDIENYKNKL